jgi:hypothetical protein
MTKNEEILAAFRHNTDRSWTCVKAVAINHPAGRIEIVAGTTLVRGTRFMGVDLAAWLDAMAQP